MKKLFTIVSMTLIIPALTSCGGGPKGDMPWIVDRFDDIKVIRYEVPGFDALPLEEKELIYYLSEAAKCGRDILFDQNCPVNLPVRRTLETVYENYKGDRTTAEWKALEKYLKKVWFANGIHHHYSNDKFVPEFTEGYLLDAIETIPEEKFGSLNSLRGEVCRAIFDPALYPTKLNQKAGDDLLLTSSSNYYHNVSQAEAEAFYADMAAADAGNPEPVSYGLNSQLTKDDAEAGRHVFAGHRADRLLARKGAGCGQRAAEDQHRGARQLLQDGRSERVRPLQHRLGEGHRFER